MWGMVAGHAVPTALRQRKMDAGTHVIPFIQLEAYEMVPPAVRLGLPTSTQSRTPS